MQRSVIKYWLYFVLLMRVTGWSQEMFPFPMSWNDTASTVISLNNLNPAITSSSAITIDADGHLTTAGGRIRLWGTNLAFGANYPTHAEAEILAARLAKYGFNVVRIHHADRYDASTGRGIWQTLTPDRQLSATQLDRLDYLIYQLKLQGIYTNLNLLVSRPFNSGTELDPSIDTIADYKVKTSIAIFDPAMRTLQKNYASALLTHVNPYTTLAYKSDPAIAFIEINNETGMMNSFKKGRFEGLPSYYDTELNTLWNTWLKAKYVNQSGLLAQWVIADSCADTMLVNGNFATGTVSPWYLQATGSPASVATASIVNEGPSGEKCAKILITSPGQLDWHVQMYQTGIPIVAGQYYTLSFQAKANIARTIRPSCSQGHSPYGAMGLSKTVNVSTDWQNYSITFQASSSDTNSRINMSGMGLVTGTVWLHNLELKPAGVLGAQMLVNGTFSTGTISSWTYQLTGSPAAQGSVAVTSEGPSGENCVQLSVTSVGQEDWHAQFYQSKLSVVSGKIYTLTFQAKSSTPRLTTVSCSMGHDPYAGLGLSRSINLTTDWQTFVLPFMATGTDTNSRVCVARLGLETGTVSISNIQFQEGGIMGIYPDENLDAVPPTVHSFSFIADPIHSPAAVSDWYQFMTDTESGYWTDMKNYIKNTVKAKALVVATTMGNSTPNVMSKMDVIDCHNYASHPQFPGTDWDSSNWFVSNTSTVNNPGQSLPARMSVRPLLGKPMVVSEFNTAAPCNFEAECAMLMAAYGNLQDIDALYSFDYSSGSDWSNNTYLHSYFDLEENSVKMAGSRAAALIFRRADFATAQSQVVVPIDVDLENQLMMALPNSNPSGLDASLAGENKKTGLIHRIRVSVEGQAIPAGSLTPGTTNVDGPVYLSDTGELNWNTTLTNSGVVTGNTAKTKMVVGFGSGKIYKLGNVTIVPGTSILNGYSAFSLSALDGTSIETSSKMLLTVLGCQKNTTASYSIYPNTPTTFPPPYGANITFKSGWGAGPLIVEGVQGVITIPFAASKVTVWSLDNCGNRMVQVPVTSVNSKAQFTTGSMYQTVWYEINVAP